MVDHIGEGTKFGRYALLEKIGTGGMAEIFRAKTFGAAGFEKEFAIKLILPSLVDDSEFVEMFINEAKIAVSLYHANIVQVFDLGEIDGQYYIAMEYVLGKDLLDILARCAEQDLKIPLNLVLFITMEMLKGLNFAHRAKDPFGEDLNIIHRDVSPSNIMISYAGDVKVGDFGVAKAAIERTLTESGTLKGKVGYMSPEQVMGDEIDARSDIFAAGVVFFEALSMSRLFVGGSDLEVMLKVRDADVEESLAEAEPLPSGLRTIVEKALTKHPEERFQTSGEFYQALVDFCYQHSIKVTGTDLANFMRRLFAEEIEEEKSKRREEPRLDELMPDAQFDEFSTQSSDQKAASEAEGARASASKQEQQGDPASAPNEGSLAQASTKRSEIDGSGIRSGRAARYRYRDSSGLIYGPMRLEALVELIEQQDLLEGDRVSVDDGPWQPPHEIEQLAAHLPDEIEGAGIEDTEVADVARSAHVSNPSEASASSAVVDEQSDKTDEAVGDQSTTVPEESALSRELEEAVTSLEQLSESVAQQQSEASSPEIPSFGGPSSAFSEGRDDEIRTGTVRLVDDSEATQQAIEELK
ncbi:MAG: serine/threonine protein kinase, partial [Persicimonas sp.]